MDEKCEIGVYGLGVMGASLAVNMIRNGYYTALYSVSEYERKNLFVDKGRYIVCEKLDEFIRNLQRPRRIFLMITAGEPVDAVLSELIPLLEPGDIIMDGGNSHYKDTERRVQLCAERELYFMGIGVSGGEKGALNGPCIMVGGSEKAWNKVKKILQCIAADFEGRPCCEYIAGGGAGHYVKMVHNGIEYAILEMMAEIYQYLREIQGKSLQEVCGLFYKWNQGRLGSYLMEISIRVLDKKDTDGTCLIDKILDIAEQKGTGKWTVMEAVERGVYLPSIYEAQAARFFSAKKTERIKGARSLSFQPVEFSKVMDTELEDALLLAIITAYSQGFELIASASAEKGWLIDMAALASVWKSGCIIRSQLLTEIEKADFISNEPLILSDTFSYAGDLEHSLRKTAASALSGGLPVPALTSALNYYDYYRAAKMPMDFIQALRDCFGAHTYKRYDKEGNFHTEWEK